MRKADAIINNLEKENERLKDDIESLERKTEKVNVREVSTLKERLQDAER